MTATEQLSVFSDSTTPIAVARLGDRQAHAEALERRLAAKAAKRRCWIAGSSSSGSARSSKGGTACSGGMWLKAAQRFERSSSGRSASRRSAMSGAEAMPSRALSRWIDCWPP